MEAYAVKEAQSFREVLLLEKPILLGKVVVSYIRYLSGGF
jgi:hypothetical protein